MTYEEFMQSQASKGQIEGEDFVAYRYSKDKFSAHKPMNAVQFEEVLKGGSAAEKDMARFMMSATNIVQGTRIYPDTKEELERLINRYPAAVAKIQNKLMVLAGSEEYEDPKADEGL